MSKNTVIDWSSWANTPMGRYILSWEQRQFDRVVADIFGYNALQLGLPQLSSLKESRITNRYIALEKIPLYPTDINENINKKAGCFSNASLLNSDILKQNNMLLNEHNELEDNDSLSKNQTINMATANNILPLPPFQCDFLELPILSQSLDLLILPHTLELTPEPHQLLREAERVLIPEGKLIVTGFNTSSLLGARQLLGKIVGHSYLPAHQDLIPLGRLKDWMNILNFEINQGLFGCYQPPLQTEKWMNRFKFIEAAGDRWWPIFGSIYMFTAIKRVSGIRLVGPCENKKIKPLVTLRPVATSKNIHHKINE